MRGFAFTFIAAAAIAYSAAEASLAGFRLLRIDGMPGKWAVSAGSSVDDVVVTYAFVDEPSEFPTARNCERVEPLDALLARSRISKALLKAETRAAFDLWQQHAKITFIEGGAHNAGILIGAHTYDSGRAFADVAYRDGIGSLRQIERSLICLNPTKPWKVGFDGNLAVYDLRYTLVHEIGHAIGLDHPHSAGQLMSATYQEDFRTLQHGDISGALAVYGARDVTNNQKSRARLATSPANAR